MRVGTGRTSRNDTRWYDGNIIDGARINFGDGWALVRASNTQPVLVLRFEAESPEALEHIRSFVEEKLKTCMR